jgi:hypothetical protein
VIPPAEKVSNDAPPRVPITFSPPRVQNTATQQRVANQTTSSLLMPNSHRRQHTHHRRAVTPPTTHVMVIRSAGQQYNLSQDMIAETINQANHCFSFPTIPSTNTQKKVIHNEQIFIMPEMANAVICPETGKSLKHQELITKLRYKIKCMRSTANEINRLYNTNMIIFIRRSNIPRGHKVTYGSFVVAIKDHKEEKERTRLTLGGDQIEYPGNKSTRTAGLTTAKILIKSVISTLGAKFLVIDIKKFYLNTPLGRFEYMVINLSSLPQETIDKYDLIGLAQYRKVKIEIQKGMYRLPQAGILANELLQRNLAKDGYRPTQHTHGLWKHDTHPISFSLLVDDFGVKYVGREHAEHLMECIKKNYNISSDWKGSAYCGLTLEWDYKNRTVDLSMPGYVKAALHKYQHADPTRPEHAPHTWNPPVYGAKTQYVENETTSPALSAKDVNKLQQLTGTLLCYARAVDPTLIITINVLASEQSKATSDTAYKVIKLLNCCNTHPETKIRYHASDMILYIHSDASYLSEKEAKSRAGGLFYMGSSAETANKLTNGAILIISTVLKHVMSSAAEIGAVFINAKEEAVIRTTLEELGHPQPPHHWKQTTPLPQDTAMAQ